MNNMSTKLASEMLFSSLNTSEIHSTKTIVQNALLDVATIKKEEPDDDSGVHLMSTNDGVHQVSIRPLSPVHPCATPEEHEAGAVTKLRYMDFRDTRSSSRQLGFRIEAMQMHGSPDVTDLQKVRCREEVVETMTDFMRSRDSVRRHVLAQLHFLRDGLERSDFFSRHEVIGSSVLIVFDDDKAGIWIIDFAKTRSLPEGVTVTHRDPWVMGDHEEGFLFGLDNLIEVVKNLKMNRSRKLGFLLPC